MSKQDELGNQDWLIQQKTNWWHHFCNWCKLFGTNLSRMCSINIVKKIYERKFCPRLKIFYPETLVFCPPSWFRLQKWKEWYSICHREGHVSRAQKLRKWLCVWLDKCYG